MGSKLKNFDYKSFAINHFEKFIFGAVALFAVMAVYGSDWASYDKHPQSFIDKVDEGLGAISTGTWPEAEMEANVSKSNIVTKSEELMAGLDASKYRYSTDMSWPLYPPHQPIREPEWLAVTDLIVDGGKVVIPVNKDASSTGGFVDGSSGSDPFSQALANSNSSNNDETDDFDIDFGSKSSFKKKTKNKKLSRQETEQKRAEEKAKRKKRKKTTQ